jgi:hypothetical protein
LVLFIEGGIRNCELLVVPEDFFCTSSGAGASLAGAGWVCGFIAGIVEEEIESKCGRELP